MQFYINSQRIIQLFFNIKNIIHIDVIKSGAVVPRLPCPCYLDDTPAVPPIKRAYLAASENKPTKALL